MVHIVQQVACRLCQQGDNADDEPAEDEKDNGRCVNDGAAGQLTRCVTGKAMAVAPQQLGAQPNGVGKEWVR